jgi:FKBP-type peptidyl-prolyl cis-trans isomerase
MVKKFFFLGCLSIIVFAACKKNDTGCNLTDSNVVAPVSEQKALHDSLTALGINATLAPSGFYYIIHQPGDGASVPAPCSTVAVYYRGGFLNGQVFDSTSADNPAVFQLGRLVPGWIKGLPLIKKNGEITLYLPPALGYGYKDVKDNSGQVVIPANSNLVFKITLLDLQ